MRLIGIAGIAQAAEMPLADPQQLRCLDAAQLLRLMQPNRIDDPGHSDLRQHAIPPAQTGQIVCYKTRTDLVSPTRAQPIGLASQLTSFIVAAPQAGPGAAP